MTTPPDSASPSAVPVIVGGGLAGLAAAAGLASQGVAATLLESRPRLGGRAGSFHDAAADEWIDHCQHVSLGCCTNLAWLMKLVGLDNLFRRDRTLHFVAPPRPDTHSANSPSIHHLAAGPWPAPLHLATSLRRLGFLDRRQRREIRRGLLALARDGKDVDEPLLGWLQQHGQSAGAIDHFWQVILVSALSETLDRIAVHHARHVFVTGFLGHRRGWELLIPTVPLEELYGQRLVEWLTRQRITLRTGTRVAAVELDGETIRGVALQDGTRLDASAVVLAVPQHRVADLLPDSLAADPQLVGLAGIETAPIAAVHAWFDRPFTGLPHAVLVGRLGQWMFRRPLPDGGDHVQVVISAARQIVSREREGVIEEVLGELRAIWPEAAEAGLRRARLVIEHRAVFSPAPGVEKLRPPQQSPVAGLQLAGDWTRTGWPGTMEGAVRSGLLAAEHVLAGLGRPARLLQPDLPTGLLARWLLRL